MANKITVKFEAHGDKALKLAIDSLARAQKNYEKNVHLVEQRVSRNTNAHTKQSAVLNKVKGQFAVLRNSLLLYAFGYGILHKTIGTVISAYGEQELAEKKLEQALGRTSKALLSQASALQKVTTFGDETIISAQSLLAAFIKDEKQLKKATVATLDLAAAKGMDLASAADLVGKTLGSSTNSLSRYGIEVEGAVGSTQRLDSLTNNIAKTFGGQATAQADTLTGSMQQLGNAFGDVQEKIGKRLAPAVKFLAQGFTNLITSSSEASDSLIEDRKSMERLFMLLKSSNATMEDRASAIQAINNRYGHYLPNLLSEQDTLKDIKKAHEDVSRSILQQIAIEVNREKITAIMKEQFALDEKRKKQIVEVEDTQVRLNDAFDDHAKASKELEDTYIEGISVQGRYKDDTADFEKALVSTTSASDAFSFSIENARRAHADATEGLRDTEAQMEKNREEMDKLTQAGISMGESFFTFDRPTGGGNGTKKLTESQIKLNSELEKSFIRLKGANNVITKAQEERSLLEQDLLSLQEMVNQGHKDEIELLIAKNNAEVQEIKIKKDKAKIFTDLAKQGAKDSLLLTQQLVKDERRQKQIAFLGAMVDVVSAGVATFKKVSEVSLPPIPFLAASAQVAIGTGLAAQILKYEQGGLVGGRRHNEGGTIIEAERGEFVMSRDAVESIGVANLERLNTGGSAININITGNVMSSDFVEGELAEKIQEAVRKGVDFGVS